MKPEEVKNENEGKTEDEIIEKELDQAMLRIDREKKRAAKKERELKAKSDLRQKMSVIATQHGIENDEELNMSRKLWEKVHETGFDGIGIADSDENVMSSESEESEESENDGADSEESVDDRADHINQMAEDMEENLGKQKEY